MSEMLIEETPEKASLVPERLLSLRVEEARAVRRWWQRLALSSEALKLHTEAPPLPKGMRAALRRCSSGDTAMLTEAFRSLWSQLPDQETSGQRGRSQLHTSDGSSQRERRLQTWACIGLVAAELRDEGKQLPLGRALGQQKGETRKPRMSELRFQKLMNCRSPEELVQRLRRALALVDKRDVSVVHLADNVALWWCEYRGELSQQSSKRLGFVWANDYFSATVSYQKDDK